MKFRRLFLISVSALLLASCASVKNVAYFQDVEQKSLESVSITPTRITIQPGDEIFVTVNTQNADLNSQFNLAITGSRLSQAGAAGSYSQGLQSYFVDDKGCIMFPVIGNLNVRGLSRSQAAEYIKSELVRRELVKDAVVNVIFANLHFSVLGDVSRPGEYSIDREDITIIDAISKAGDLSVTGRRDNIILIRREGNIEKIYTFDMRNMQELMASPVFFIKQNDCIYVTPNRVRANQSTVNGNNVLSASFWISITNLAMTIFNFIVR